MRVFSSVEVAKEMMLAVVVNTCGPAFHGLAPGGTKKTAAAVLSGFALVLQIGRVRDVAQILNSIVCAIPVYMVNVFVGPLPVGQRPRSSMGLKKLSASPDTRVSVPGNVSHALEKLARNRVVAILALQDLQKLVISHVNLIRAHWEVKRLADRVMTPVVRPLKLGQPQNSIIF